MQGITAGWNFFLPSSSLSSNFKFISYLYNKHGRCGENFPCFAHNINTNAPNAFAAGNLRVRRLHAIFNLTSIFYFPYNNSIHCFHSTICSF